MVFERSECLTLDSKGRSSQSNVHKKQIENRVVIEPGVPFRCANFSRFAQSTRPSSPIFVFECWSAHSWNQPGPASLNRIVGIHRVSPPINFQRADSTL